MTMKFRSFRSAVLFTLAGLSLIASGCSSGPGKAVGGIFGRNKDKTDETAPKEEDRVSILALEERIEADPRFAGTLISLPPSYRNLSWTQPGGEADHTLHHLSGEGSFETIWRKDLKAKTSRRARLTATPIAADGRIYVLDAAGRVSALEMETGERLWRADLAPEFKNKFRVRQAFSPATIPAEIGFGGGVAYENGKVYVTSGFRFVAAIDAETGEELWRFETEAPVRTPPTVHRGVVYFVTNTNEIIALNGATGTKDWSFQSFEETARILSSSAPAAAGDLIVAPFSSGELVAFLADGGRPVWNDTLSRNTTLTALSTLNDIAGSPVIDRGLVYVVSHAGRFAAVDIRSGQRVWERPVASLQTPWVAGDYIFTVSVDGELVCMAREDGAVVWVSQLQRYEKQKKRKGRIAWSGPILVGDHLILVSSSGQLVKVSPLDGAVIDKRKLSAGSSVSPIVADEKIFVLTDDGKLYAVR